MKRISILFSLLIFFGISLIAQEIVTTRPQLKAAIIEGFTGINCPFCPGGNTSIQNVLNANPGKAFHVGVHAGSFAIPSGTQPDFRTNFGNALVGQAGVEGFPSATINRKYFSDLSATGGTAMDRTKYATAVQRIIKEPAIANIGFTSDYNPETRELTVNVEVYYVENMPFGQESNFINIAITESGIVGYQAGASSNYTHNRVLRHLVTGQWGDEISGMKAGDLITKTYTYTLNENWVASNCNLVVFISESRQDIITGVGSTLINGSHNGEISPDYGRIYVENSLQGGDVDETSEFELTIINGNESVAEFNIIPDFKAPEDWQVWYEINDEEFTDNTVISIDGDEIQIVIIKVRPGETAGSAQCRLFISSVQQPTMPQKMTEVFVISGVENLIVNGSGTNTNVVSEDYEIFYTESLTRAGCNTFGAIPGYVLQQAFEENMLVGVKSIFMNIGYTIPVLTVGQTLKIRNFIDEGGNLFISGQDIGKDIMAIGGFSTSSTQKSFFQNYLGAAYVNAGNDQNNSVQFLDDDVFGGIAEASITDPYGEGLKPDNIVRHGTSIEFAKFANNRAAGLRNVVNGGKIVYIPFGLEQVQNVAIRDSIIKRTYVWFNQEDIEENSIIGFNDNNINVYPNPATDFLMVSADFREQVSYTVYSLTGVIIKTGILDNSNQKLDISNLKQGMYFLKIHSDNDSFINLFHKSN